MNISPVILLCVFHFLDQNDLARAAGACNCFEWWSVIKRYRLLERNWEELDLSGTGNFIVLLPSESILFYIPDMLEISLNAIVKSPFLTNDAICFPELVTIEAHGLESRAVNCAGDFVFLFERLELPT